MLPLNNFSILSFFSDSSRSLSLDVILGFNEFALHMSMHVVQGECRKIEFWRMNYDTVDYAVVSLQVSGKSLCCKFEFQYAIGAVRSIVKDHKTTGPLSMPRRPR